jgi:A/G-specific adenine glycosylase
LGYYSRARHLHRAAGMIVSEHDGKIPDDPQAFRALPGIGDYIAAAVMSIAFGRVIPVIDGNVKRVLARLLEIDTPVNQNGSHKRFLEPATGLICPRQPADFNQAIMELGALVCRPKNPECTVCPLAELCLANQHKTTAEFPKRIATRKIPHRHLVYGVVLKKGKMLVLQRPEAGFLGGLWEFPAIAASLGQITAQTVERGMIAETGLTISADRRLTRIRHAYTHFTLSADVYVCQYMAGRVRLNRSRSHRWVTLRALKRLPTHKAIHKFLDFIEDAVP